jgi:hypothetical protein
MKLIIKIVEENNCQKFSTLFFFHSFLGYIEYNINSKEHKENVLITFVFC